MSSLRPPGISAPLGDVIAVAVVVLLGVLPFPDEISRAQGLMVVPALVPALVMPLRRRWPILALVVALACNAVMAFAGVLAPSTLAAVTIAVFSVAYRNTRLVSVISVGAAALLVLLVSAVPLNGNFFDSLAMQFVTFILLAGALGDAARSRRDYASALRERAERAERDRDDEAHRRVSEERMRIARDLHDVVAHQISVISLSAGVASSSLENRPDRAREALTTIRSASRTILADIGALLALLRGGADEERHHLRPQPGLDQLEDLVTGFAAVGLRVELEREPDSASLSPASDHVAYLALQEGLTNAHKHGAGGRALVSVLARDGYVHLTVVNAASEDEANTPVSGHGLRGLRERVASVRGTVATSREHSQHRLEVQIPYEDDYR